MTVSSAPKIIDKGMAMDNATMIGTCGDDGSVGKSGCGMGGNGRPANEP